jgi:hypothetical protein
MSARHILAIVVVAVAVTVLAPSVVRADLAVTNLRVGSDPAADPAMTVFPPGTRSAYARFDYEDASNHRLGVTVLLHGGIVGFASRDRYDGKGSASVEISGASVLRNVTNEVVEAGRTARSNAEKAATQSYGLAEYLIQVQAGLNRVDSAVVVLEGVGPQHVDAAQLARVVTASAATHRLLERAVRAADDPRKREIAASMDQPLEDLVTAAQALFASAQEATSVPLPVSGSAWDYVVSVSVDGSPALTTEFVVSGYRILAPAVQK